MMKTMCNRLIVASIVLFAFVSLVSSERQQQADGDGGSQALAASSNSHRSKRRVEDVEKLMRQDHLMALLICDMCVENACALDYCVYCQDCADLQPLSAAAPSSEQHDLLQFGPKGKPIAKRIPHVCNFCPKRPNVRYG